MCVVRPDQLAVRFLFVVFFFFKQKTAYEIGTGDWSSDVCSSDLLTNSRCGSNPAFYNAHFSLRQRPAFYTARFSLRQHPSFLYCPFLVAAAPHFLYWPGSRCGSAPAFFTDHFLLVQRPRFLY